MRNGSAGGAAPRVQPVLPGQITQIIAGLSPSGPKLESDAALMLIKTQAVQTAITLVNALTGTDTKLAVLSGAPLHASGGETSSASQVYFDGM